jgi:hypothetical protein
MTRTKKHTLFPIWERGQWGNEAIIQTHNNGVSEQISSERCCSDPRPEQHGGFQDTSGVEKATFVNFPVSYFFISSLINSIT